MQLWSVSEHSISAKSRKYDCGTDIKRFVLPDVPTEVLHKLAVGVLVPYLNLKGMSDPNPEAGLARGHTEIVERTLPERVPLWLPTHQRG